MYKKLMMAAAMIAAMFSASAQNETMYLVKGDRVVAKYDVDDVDYATFRLPDNVRDEKIWITTGNIGKNSVTYTVNTNNPNVAYAHNILSFYDVNYMAMDFYGDMLENLDDESKMTCIKYALSTNAYMGMGSQTYYQTDFQPDGTGNESRFSVVPGTDYFICAWEIDPAADYAPLETFVCEQISTLDPEQSNASLNVAFKRMNEYGAAFTFDCSDDILYLRTCWGYRGVMESYKDFYGRDFLMGTFGQSWSPAFLQGEGDFMDGIENATWSADEPGEYILYVDGYDHDGNIVSTEVVVTREGESQAEGPKITIFSKEKRPGYVSINFEISPSNVSEAYVRMADENFVDDRLNMGYELHEIAMGGDATDITDDINTAGEYTFINDEVDDSWKSILIYARDKDGNRTTQRINFNTEESSNWDIAKPVSAAPARRMAPVKGIRSKRNPTIKRLTR